MIIKSLVGSGLTEAATLVIMFALSTLRLTKFLLKNFTTTTTTITCQMSAGDKADIKFCVQNCCLIVSLN